MNKSTCEENKDCKTTYIRTFQPSRGIRLSAEEREELLRIALAPTYRDLLAKDQSVGTDAGIIIAKPDVALGNRPVFSCEEILIYASH